MGTIFTDDFPLIEREKELQDLIRKYPQYDSYYVASGAIKDRRDYFNEMYSIYYPYADRNFLSDLKKHFHQRTWEMYLSYVLLQNNISITSKDIGPDILFEHEGQRIWIECIACGKGDGENKVPTMEYGVANSVPDDGMLLRIASALKEKREKYDRYLLKGVIKKNEPFVIAVNGGMFGYPEGVYSLILRSVYAVGYPTLSFPVGGGPTKRGVSTIPHIEKKSGMKVPMTFFLNKENDCISAAIYSGNTIINHKNMSGEDIIIVHNAMAQNPLPDVFSFLKNYKVDGNGNLQL